MRVLVTGGSGFVGSALIRQLLHDTPHEVINVDLHQGRGLERIGKNTRYFYIKADITNQEAMDAIFDKFRPQTVVHLAEKNIYDLPRHLLQNNVYGTFVILEAVRNFNCEEPEKFKLIMGSSDEVYGHQPETIKDRSPFRPRTPYAATVAASDCLASAWFHTYQIPIITTHTSEVYGPYQDINKFIPSIIDKGCNSMPIQIEGPKKQTHDLIYVEDYAAGLRRTIELGKPGQTYNFSGNEIWTTEQIVRITCEHLDCMVPRKQGHLSLVEFENKDETEQVAKGRMDNKKVFNELIWLPGMRFMFGIRDTVEFQIKQIFESAGVRMAS
jgi:dTDP-glucose 4,6-dehydratase